MGIRREGKSAPARRQLWLIRWSVALCAGWSIMVGVLLTWNLLQVQQYVEEQAHREIRATLAKGRALSEWAREHGGVYVPISESHHSDPRLSNVPERDVATPSGRTLTLVNPATLLNEYYTAVGNPSEVKGRLVSTAPINPANQADEWETKVLHRLRDGKWSQPAEVSEVVTLEGKRVLRLFTPRHFDVSCVACHAADQARIGDIAGGISFSVPLDTDFANTEYITLGVGYGTLWLIGLLGIRGGVHQLGAHIEERDRAREKIQRDYVSQQVIASVLKLSIEPVEFRTKLERSLDLILSTPWLSVQAKGVIFVAKEDGTLRLVAERGLSDSVRQGCDRVAPGQCLCGRVAEQRTPIFTDHIDGRHDHVFDDMLPHGHYCMPLLSGERLLGVLTLYVNHGHRSSTEERQFLSAISHALGGIIQQHRAEEELRYSAFYDELTGLPNRYLFMERIGQALTRVRKGAGGPFSVLYLDLDRFKTINDSLGHTAGDAVLVAVAERLRRCVRPEDTVARLGGDEFTILLEGASEAEPALIVARRIRKAMQRPLEISNHEIFTSISIGVALAGGEHHEVADLMREADTAMYHAKQLGTAQASVFDQAMHDRAVSLLKLETELRRGVERDEFVPYYQPIVSASTGALLGFEALVRWIHPERGLVSPAEFIPVAEETGLINSIGRRVLHAACRQIRLWHRFVPEGRKPYVSVNLSAVQFLQSDLLEQVDEALADSGLSGRHLCLEVTESVLIDQTAMTRNTLAALRDRGVRLAIDDFGTGYSSLSYLHAFPFDALKIDRTFTANIAEGAEHRGIVQAVVAIAHHLGMSVIAEGVEDREQLELLQRLGCENVQGFYFSPPIPAAAAFDWLQRRNRPVKAATTT